MTVDKIQNLDIGRYDAIIARGFSYHQLKEKYPALPIIELSISGYDIIRTMWDCRKKYDAKRIAVCGFYGKIYEAADLCSLLGCEVKLYPLETHTYLEDSIQSALSDDCDALIGGYSAVALAEKHGIPCCLIRTGEDAVSKAVNEAIRTAEQVRRERVIAETYKTIIYASKDGVLYVDQTGIIRVRNRVAKQMTQFSSLTGKPLKKTLPYLFPCFEEALKSGQETVGKILAIPKSKLTVSASFTPVVVKQQISGVVITLTDITQIQKLENQIRKSLGEKGLQAKYTFQDIIHNSTVMKSAIETARKYAKSDSNVIIVGETGTGKELFAQSIHNASSRKNGPFVAVNCAALPENLLESELFGYVEGAFTGTVKGGKMGLFEQAHGGTLFLDEIGEISLALQAKLLRVLQEKEVRRIGDNRVISINVRILSATNKNLQRLADQGLFRWDLIYRLDVLRVFVPPLRQRENDVELLFLHLLQQRSHEMGTEIDVMPEALLVLHDYPFTGNIRELSNIAERSSVLCTNQVITREDIIAALYPPNLENGNNGKPYVDNSVSDEQQKLLEALEQCHGNQTLAAKQLGIDRTTLWRKMKKYKLK